jgi:hypothetical protein
MLLEAMHWDLETKQVNVEAQVGCGGSRVKPLRFNGSMSWSVFVTSLRPWRETTTRQLGIGHASTRRGARAVCQHTAQCLCRSGIQRHY